MATAVAPDPDDAAVAGEFIYRMEVSGPLPLINLERTPIMSMLSEANHQHFLGVMRRMYARFSTLYRVSGVLMVTVLLTPTEVGYWLSLPTAIMSLPALVCSFVMYSTDILKVLPRQYEFWFFTVLNLIHWVCLASFYSDFRILSLVGGVLGTQSVILIDSNFRTVTSGIRSTTLAAPLLLILGSTTFFRIIDTEEANYRVFPIAKVKVTLVDVFANAAATLAVFIARKGYAKRQVLITQLTKLQTIRCVVFRSKLQLKKPQARDGASRSLRVETRLFVMQKSRSGSTTQVARTISSFLPRMTTRTATTDVVPLDLSALSHGLDTSAFDSEHESNSAAHAMDDVAEREQQVSLVSMQLSAIDVRDVVAPRFSPLYKPLSPPKAIVFYASGVIGLVTTVWTVLHRPAGRSNLPPTTTEYSLAITALVTTLVFFLTCVASFHRQLTKSLLRNFDFLFSSVQFTIAMLLISDMVQWDFRTLGAMAWLLWFHCVLFLDALTPHVKHNLRLRKVFLLPVIVSSLVGIIFIIYGFFFSDVADYFQDRTLWDTHFRGKPIALRTKSLLMNRLFTVLLWSFRLIWEVSRCPDDELIFIRGSLDYFTPMEMFPPPGHLQVALPAAVVAVASQMAKLRRGLSVRRQAVGVCPGPSS